MPNPIITAALTGPVATKADNPGMPGTVAEIAADAKAAYDAGAAVIHIHLRDDDGNMTVDLDVARRTVEAVRAICLGIVQLSTGGLAFTYEDRMKMVEAKPAMATLNPCTMTFGAAEFRNPPRQMMELAARMIELGIKPEVEIYDTGHLEMMLYLLHKGLLVEPIQVSFVMGVRGGMKGDPALLAHQVREQRRVTLHAAAHAHHERDLNRLNQQALVQQVEHHLEMPGVVDLYLRLDAQLDHARGQLHHLPGRVAELGRAERHRARVQGGHGRLGLDHLHAVLVREGEAARGQLDNAEADGADRFNGAPRHVEVDGHVAVVVAQVDVDDGRAGVVGLSL